MENKVCNICGKTLDNFDLQNNPNIHTQLSYGSKYDGSTVDLDLCTDCWDFVLTQLHAQMALSHRILDRNKPNKNYNV